MTGQRPSGGLQGSDVCCRPRQLGLLGGAQAGCRVPEVGCEARPAVLGMKVTGETLLMSSHGSVRPRPILQIHVLLLL